MFAIYAIHLRYMLNRQCCRLYLRLLKKTRTLQRAVCHPRWEAPGCNWISRWSACSTTCSCACEDTQACLATDNPVSRHIPYKPSQLYRDCVSPLLNVLSSRQVKCCRLGPYAWIVLSQTTSLDHAAGTSISSQTVSYRKFNTFPLKSCTAFSACALKSILYTIWFNRTVLGGHVLF